MVFALNDSKRKDNPDEKQNGTGQYPKDDKEPDDQLICFGYIFQKVFFFEKNGEPSILERSKDHGNYTGTGNGQVVIRHLFKGTVFFKEEFVAEIDHNAENCG